MSASTTGAVPAGAIISGAVPAGAIISGAVPAGAIISGAVPAGAKSTGLWVKPDIARLAFNLSNNSLRFLTSGVSTFNFCTSSNKALKCSLSIKLFSWSNVITASKVRYLSSSISVFEIW